MEYDTTQQVEALIELDTRHDDLLHQLDLLDQRVVSVLRECQPKSPSQEQGITGQDEGIECTR